MQIYISDFISFNTPVVYGTSADAPDATHFVNFLSANLTGLLPVNFNGFSPITVTIPPASFGSISTLDDFLAGQDTMILGGPLINSAALFFQKNLQLEIASQTELLAVIFSTLSQSSSGTAFQTLAPQLLMSRNSNFSHYSFPRILDTYGNIMDAVSIIRLRGTTNDLLYVAGNRDFGTATALFMLEWSVRGTTVWPSRFGDVSILKNWQTAFSSSNIAFVLFSIPNTRNTMSLIDYENYIQNNGVGIPTVVTDFSYSNNDINATLTNFTNPILQTYNEKQYVTSQFSISYDQIFYFTINSVVAYVYDSLGNILGSVLMAPSLGAPLQTYPTTVNPIICTIVYTTTNPNYIVQQPKIVVYLSIQTRTTSYTIEIEN